MLHNAPKHNEVESLELEEQSRNKDQSGGLMHPKFPGCTFTEIELLRTRIAEHHKELEQHLQEHSPLSESQQASLNKIMENLSEGISEHLHQPLHALLKQANDERDIKR